MKARYLRKSRMISNDKRKEGSSMEWSSVVLDPAYILVCTPTEETVYRRVVPR